MSDSLRRSSENPSGTRSRRDGDEGLLRPRFAASSGGAGAVLRGRNARLTCLALLNACLFAAPAGARRLPVVPGAERVPNRFAARIGGSAPSRLASPAVVQATAPSRSLQVLVKLITPSDDGARIAAEASRISGLTVRYVSATSPQWHALLIECATAADCEAAVKRLSEARDTYFAVQRDMRERAY